MEKLKKNQYSIQLMETSLAEYIVQEKEYQALNMSSGWNK